MATIINNSLLGQNPTEMMKYQSVDSVVELADAVHYPVVSPHLKSYWDSNSQSTV